MAADFHRYYGTGLEAMFAAGCTAREVAACARWLPAEAAVWRAMRPAEPDDDWTLEAQLLALIADRLGVLIYVEAKRAGGKPQKPKQIPRPGLKPDQDITQMGADPLPLEEMDEWLGWNTPAAD